MLYHQLLNGEHIDKAAFSLEHNITERSFDRDIEDIRLFLSEIFSSNELLFDKESRTYYLTGEQPQYIDRMEAVAIGRILLSSASLRYDEMMGLLHVLLTTVSEDDANAVRRYLRRGIAEYGTNGTDDLCHGLRLRMGRCWRRHWCRSLVMDPHCGPDCWRLRWRRCGVYGGLQSG